MRELRDHKNKTIIRNYVAMPDKPLFSTLEVASATGVGLKTVQNVMRDLYLDHVIVKTNTRIGGRVYYRQPQERERLEAGLEGKTPSEYAAEQGISRQQLHQRMKALGIPTQDIHLNARQRKALLQLRSGTEIWGYELYDGEILKQLSMKGMLSIVKRGRFNTYQITDLGREAINA